MGGTFGKAQSIRLRLLNDRLHTYTPRLYLPVDYEGWWMAQFLYRIDGRNSLYTLIEIVNKIKITTSWRTDLVRLLVSSNSSEDHNQTKAMQSPKLGSSKMESCRSLVNSHLVCKSSPMLWLRLLWGPWDGSDRLCYAQSGIKSQTGVARLYLSMRLRRL